MPRMETYLQAPPSVGMSTVGGSTDLARPRPIVFFNGKFYGGQINGVHRVADRLLRQIELLAAEGAAPAAWDMRLLLPERCNWAPAFRHIRAVPQRFGHTPFWEQALLPLIAARGVLVSLANIAPLFHRQKLTMVHDAQFRISPHSYSLKRRIGYRLRVPAGARTSRRVLTVSEYARDSLETFGIARRANTDVIYNAADHMLEAVADDRIIEKWGLRRRRYCMMFGSTSAYKNVQLIFDAFDRPELNDLDLVVIGASAETMRRQGMVPSDRARFVGQLADGELRALYEVALCLLFPSRTEGFGLPPLEAMTCGCPVIAAPAGAIPEVCRDAVLYASPSNCEDWAREIVRFSNMPALRDAKIAAGRARASAFGWAKAGNQLADAITPML